MYVCVCLYVRVAVQYNVFQRAKLQRETITHGPTCVCVWRTQHGADCTLFTAGYKYIYAPFYGQLKTEAVRHSSLSGLLR